MPWEWTRGLLSASGVDLRSFRCQECYMKNIAVQNWSLLDSRARKELLGKLQFPHKLKRYLSGFIGGISAGALHFTVAVDSALPQFPVGA